MKSLAAATLAFAAAAALFAATPSSDARKGRIPEPVTPVHLDAVQLAVTGHYDSNYGEVRLQRWGNRISGIYLCCDGGRIDGRIEGNLIRYTWTQTGASGRGVWVIASNGELIGTWGNGTDEASGGWNLRLKKFPAAAAKPAPAPVAACMAETEDCLRAQGK